MMNHGGDVPTSNSDPVPNVIANPSSTNGHSTTAQMQQVVPTEQHQHPRTVVPVEGGVVGSAGVHHPPVVVPTMHDALMQQQMPSTVVPVDQVRGEIDVEALEQICMTV